MDNRLQPYYPNPPSPQKQDKGFGVASLTLGIVSWGLAILPVLLLISIFVIFFGIVLVSSLLNSEELIFIVIILALLFFVFAATGGGFLLGFGLVIIIITSVLGIVFGIIQLIKSKKARAQAVVGLTLSIIAFVIFILPALLIVLGMLF